jgi:hypothetical protein
MSKADDLRNELRAVIFKYKSQGVHESIIVGTIECVKISFCNHEDDGVMIPPAGQVYEHRD